MYRILMLLTFGKLLASHQGMQHHLALCTSHIAHHYFAPGKPAVMSYPSSVRAVTERELFPQNSEVIFINDMFQNLHEPSEWHVLSVQSDKPMQNSDVTHKHQSYIIILWPEEDRNTSDSLQLQIDTLHLYTDSFNHQARFLLVVMDYNIQLPQLYALKMIETMWNPFKIINVVIMLPTTNTTLHKTCSNCEYDIINVYTSFPYDPSQCGKVKKVELLDQWMLKGNGSFRSKVNLFPSKVPNNFRGCPLVIAPIERIPFVTPTNIHGDSHGDTTYTYEGLEIEYVLLLTKAMNIAPIFLEPRVGDFVQIRLETFMEIAQGLVDITVGVHPLHLLLVRVGDPIRPYFELTMRWWVPCAKPAPRVEKIMAVFTSSVWISVLAVFVLTALAFWQTALAPSSASWGDPKVFQTFRYNLYIVWAVFLGVSVPKLPTTLRLRNMFLLYVWYSIAMTTVFQVFFISFLVNPGYGKRVENFEELVSSGLKLVTDARMLSFVNISGYWEYLRLELSTDSCSIIDECLVQLVRNKNMTTVSSKFQFEYILATVGKTEDKNKYLCTIPEIVVTSKFSMYISKGNPLLDSFNLWIQRILESGLVNRYWSQVLWNVTLQGIATAEQDSSERGENDGEFFVFTTSHLSVAFYQLLIGYFISFAVFSAECTCNRIERFAADRIYTHTDLKLKI